MFILDLQDIKCPMNLVMVKNELHNKSFNDGGKIIVKDLNAKNNIMKYLKIKNIEFQQEENIIIIYSSS